MLNRPVVDLVNDLHWLGRKLAVLRRLYQSYELIMMRILQRQRQLRDDARSGNGAVSTGMGNIFSEPEAAELRQSTLQTTIGVESIKDSVGVQLNSAATARFERLLDRIKLYCLSEIDACLTEKESLTFLVFSSPRLPSIQDADRVELQSYRPERHPSRGEVDENHDPSSQSNHLVSPGQSDDGVLFDGDPRCQRRIHHQPVLGLIRGDHVPVGGAPSRVRESQRYGRGQTDLPLDGSDILSIIEEPVWETRSNGGI